VEAVIAFLVYRFTVCIDRPSPGSHMLNLVFRNETKFAPDSLQTLTSSSSPFVSAATLANQLGGSRLSIKQKYLYGFATVIGQWAVTRLKKLLSEQQWGSEPEGSWRRRMHKLVLFIEVLWRVASLASLFVFLRDGMYRNLLERGLTMRLVYARSRVARNVNFELLHQTLLWGGLSEFMLFILPLINFRRVITFIRDIGIAGSTRTVTTGCPVCSANPRTTPHVASCGHVFCYFCLRSARLAGEFACPRCGQVVTAQEPWSVAKHGQLV
jgi:peroxin-2